MKDREFNATREGQISMAYRAQNVSHVLILNGAVRRLGGAAWEDSVIAQADDTFLQEIRNDLIEEYNAKMAPKPETQP